MMNCLSFAVWLSFAYLLRDTKLLGCFDHPLAAAAVVVVVVVVIVVVVAVVVVVVVVVVVCSQ